jgi:hypothetical protein
LKVPSYSDGPWSCPEMPRGVFWLLLAKTMKRGTMQLFRGQGPQICPCKPSYRFAAHSQRARCSRCCNPVDFEGPATQPAGSNTRATAYLENRVRDCTKCHPLALAVETRARTNGPLRGHRRFREDCSSIYNQRRCVQVLLVLPLISHLLQNILPRLENTYPRVCLTHPNLSRQSFISFTHFPALHL